MRFAEPVFLTVWDAAADMTFWVCVQDAMKDVGIRNERMNKGDRRSPGVQIAVPTMNTLDTAGPKRMRGITKLRFGRASCQQEGVEVLQEALLRLGASVETYEPDQGLIVIRYPNDEVWATYLGEMAVLLDKLGRSMRLSKQETVSKALFSFEAEVSNGRLDERALRQLKIEDSIRAQILGAGAKAN